MSNPSLSRITGYVVSEGERIYYERTGDGPPVVLCHGLGGNHAIWWQQIDALAAHYSVITWDQRGFGNSSAHSGEIGPAAARRDLHALLDHLAVEHVSLIGQSMGGWVVLGYAQSHPGRVTALVLSTTLAGADRHHVDRLISAEPARDRLGNRREHPVLSTAFCATHPALGILYNQISSFGSRPDPAQILSEMARDELTKLPLEQILVPTLVLMASQDALCPPSAMEGLVKRLPDARMRVVEGDHSVYFEQPQAWNNEVLDFLDVIHRID